MPTAGHTFETLCVLWRCPLWLGERGIDTVRSGALIAAIIESGGDRVADRSLCSGYTLTPLAVLRATRAAVPRAPGRGGWLLTSAYAALA